LGQKSSQGELFAMFLFQKSIDVIEKSTQGRELRNCLSSAVIVYRDLLERTNNLVKSALGLQGQRLLALDCCPACFGRNLETGNQSNPKLNDRLIICLDGNFQQRHHQAAGKNFSPLITPNLLVQPGKLNEMRAYIDELEAIHKIPKTKKVRCSNLFISIFFSYKICFAGCR
jgi:hypothetical protein